jgi:hypothetical protein
MKKLVAITKVLGSVAAAASLLDMLPAKFVPIGLLLIGVASALKEVVLVVGDYLDDKQLNKSFKGG